LQENAKRAKSRRQARLGQAALTPSVNKRLCRPKSILGPRGDHQNIIGIIIIAIAFGIALRGVKHKTLNGVQGLVEVAYEVLLTVLHWIIKLVPIGVFAIVANEVGTEGFAPFRAMGAFILAVIIALVLQTVWYLLRICPQSVPATSFSSGSFRDSFGRSAWGSRSPG
jgi:Na+/H+-dicarboxylate symporter